MKHSFFVRSVAFVLLTQMLLCPVASSWAASGVEPVQTLESGFTEEDARDEARAINALLDGQSDATSNRLDTFGLFDWEAPEEVSAVRYIDTENLQAVRGATGSLEIRLRGQVLLKSRFPVVSVQRHGDFIAFIEPNSYQAGGLSLEAASSGETGVQSVSFVDLKTYGQLLAAGREEATLPVFSLPIATSGSITQLRPGEGGLDLISSTATAFLPVDVIKGFSDAQTTALNVTAALVNPETYEYAKPVVEEAEKYFLQTIHLAKKNFGGQADAAGDFAQQLSRTLSDRKPEAKDILESSQLHQTIQNIQSFMEAQRKTSTRLKILWARMSIPKPTEAPMKVREAIAMVASGLAAKDLEKRGQLTREGMLQLLNNRAVRWGTAIAAASALGLLYPEQVHQHFYEALDIGRSILSTVGGRAREMGGLGARAAKLAFDGFTKPSVFYKAYLSPENRGRFIVGVTGIIGTAFLMMSSAFVMTNTWLLVRSLKERGWNNLKDLKDAFIARQRKIKLDDLIEKKQELEREAQARGEKINANFSAKDEARLDAIFEEIRTRDRGWVSKFFDKVKQWDVFKRKTYASIAENPEKEPDQGSESESAEERLTRAEISGFGAALKHFLYGESSLVDAAVPNGRAWNGFELVRLAVVSPTMLLTMLSTPNFYNVAIGSPQNVELGKLHLPTKFNGGMDTTAQALKRAFKTLTFDRDLKTVNAWEAKILPVEKMMIESVIKEAYKGLGEYIEARNHSVENLIRTAGIRDVSDPDLETLSLSQRTFFRAYVDQLLEKSMQKFVSGVAARAGKQSFDENSSVEELKRATLDQIDALEIDSQDAKKIVSEVAARKEAFRKAESIADHSFKNLRHWASINLKYAALAGASPGSNRTVKQVQIRVKQFGSKAAVSRAVRAVLPKVLMKKTIGFMFSLFGLAGVTSGVMQPLHEEMFGPNSYFYMGKVPFVSGLLVGLYITLYEGIPQKLQRDFSHAEHFNDEYPEGKDAEGGFLRWYFKRTFLNSNNKFWDNQKIHWRVFFGQLIPSTVLYFFTGMASLGRFDLDGFMAHLFLSTTNPANGLDVKLEQGMEFASTYPLKDFPKEYHSHPRVREYLAKWQMKKRFWFSFWEMLYVDARNQVLHMMVRMNDLKNNSQAFLRLLDPEELTPTERFARFADKQVIEPLKKVPYVGAAGAAVAGFCERLLTNGYQDYQKYKPEGWVKKEGPKGGRHHH